MAKQHYSISNHSGSSDAHRPSNQHLHGPHSDSGPVLTLNYPPSSPSTPTTQIFDPRSTSSTSHRSDLSTESDSEDITTTLPQTLKLTQNIAAALETYITKMRADLVADRVPLIAIYEIRCAERYQAVLRIKARRMQLIQDALDRHIAENGQTRVRWAQGADELWARELEYVRKARKYLIGAHVFYKINYELAK